MKAFSIGGVPMNGVKLCARCVLTTVDQQTAVAGKEPLRTLSQYRTMNNKVMFGQNVLVRGSGVIRLNSEIVKW